MRYAQKAVHIAGEGEILSLTCKYVGSSATLGIRSFNQVPLRGALTLMYCKHKVECVKAPVGRNLKAILPVATH